MNGAMAQPMGVAPVGVITQGGVVTATGGPAPYQGAYLCPVSAAGHASAVPLGMGAPHQPGFVSILPANAAGGGGGSGGGGATLGLNPMAPVDGIVPDQGPYAPRCAEDVPVSDFLDPCVPRGWIRAFNTALVVAAVGVVIYAGKSFDAIPEEGDPAIRREKMRLLGSAVSTVGVLAWPVIWDALAGYAIVAHHPLTLFGFAWPIVMSMLDLSYLAANKNSTQAQRVFGLGSVSNDANTLVGVAFAVSSLLVSQGDRGLANATIPLLMYALLLLIAFIVPIPSLDPDDYSGFVTGAVQRTFFNYAMGFVIAGISTNIAGQSGRGLQTALQRLCLRSQAQGDFR